jgi:hypothetical protein
MQHTFRKFGEWVLYAWWIQARATVKRGKTAKQSIAW